MFKRLIVCCDGTWNSEDMEGGTNVWKLSELVLAQDPQGVEQRVMYLPGVGTDLRRSAIGRRLSQLGGGIFGWGLNANVLEAYRWLMEEYEPGDELWLFGFSRGAYTARSLAGLIRNCGVVRRRHAQRMNQAMTIYRARNSASAPDAPQSRSFRRNYAHEVAAVRFLGVWDTVGALGVPGLAGKAFWLWNRRYRFHDVDLSRRVEHAYHAVAVDERRPAFAPSLWSESSTGQRTHVEQVWFAGVHSDVGGGYAETGLSNETLRWMLVKACAAGLAIDAEKAAAHVPDLAEPIHDSRWVVHRLPGFSRGRIPGRDARQRVHRSVDRKIECDPGYAPANVAPDLPRSED
jgi:uncharacterized protein (DUF2235 family)